MKKTNRRFFKITFPIFQKKDETIINKNIKFFINLHYVNKQDFFIHNKIWINYLNFYIIVNLNKKLTMNNMYEYNSNINFSEKMVKIIEISQNKNTILFLEKDYIYYDNNTLVKIIKNNNISNTD